VSRFDKIGLSTIERARVNSSANCALLSRRDNDLAKRDMALLTALQIDRPRLRFVAIQRPAGNTRDLLVINYRLAVLNYGHLPAEQRNIKGLPYVCLARQFRRRRQEAVYGTGMMAWPLRLGLRLDLDFIAAAQLDAAVRVLSAVEFDM